MIYLEGQPVEVTIFPDKTSQVWKLNEEVLNRLRRESVFLHRAKVIWDFEHEGELIHLAQLKDLLDSESINSILIIPTLPYARQDKSITNYSTFALKTFAKVLNSIGFEKVISTDVHNVGLTKALINNFENIKPTLEIEKAFEESGADIKCYPDLGASMRYDDIFKNELNYIVGKKVRDPETGYIEGYSLEGNIKDKRVLIVDDLCDGGMTFIKCTEKLLQGGAKEVYLYVSHGIFSKGTKRLFDAGISRIFTKDGEVNERS